MSILHVTAPAPCGGLERVVQALADGHAGRGHQVHVAAILSSADAEHPFARWSAGDHPRLHQIVVGGRNYGRERARVGELCRQLRPDVLHTHGYRPDVLDAGVARATGVPTVSTVHGFTGGDWKNRIFEHLQRRALRRFDAVVAVSRPLAEQLAAAGVPRARLHVIANGWNPHPSGTRDRQDLRRELGIAGDEFHIGWVGRLSAEKGPDVLLRALAELMPDLAPVVSFVGSGRERDRLEAEAAVLGIAHRCRWHGVVPDAARIFSAFDAFILSSRTEGTPIVLFEAMAAGVPIVATRVGGVPDVIGAEEALLVPPDDPAALAAAIRSIAASSERAGTRARAAAERLVTHYGLQPWLASYEELYRRIRSSCPAPS